jgi:hypothetical protein
MMIKPTRRAGGRFIGVYCTLRETGEYDSFVAVFWLSLIAVYRTKQLRFYEARLSGLAAFGGFVRIARMFTSGRSDGLRAV